MVVSGGPVLPASGLGVLAESESSFTSVDIGSPCQIRSTVAENDSSWNSWCDSSQQGLSTGCFDLKY